METLTIQGREYPVTGHVQAEGMSRPVPLVDIRLMSAEEEIERARRNAVGNYIREFGKEPESVEAAVSWQRERAARLVAECMEGAGQEVV